jgi:GLPGLI family protein
MMKTVFTLITALFFISSLAFAQNAHFTTGGTIEYEKSSNTFAIIKRLYGDDLNQGFMQTAFDQYKKTQPQFKVLKSTLTFGNNRTLFTPTAPETTVGGFFSIPVTDQNNVVYTDLENHTITAQKTVFEETFLLKDSLRKIKWKITDETREIAGYTCRRANGLMMDSIYVVAFFANQIPISGGPESFSGLPGMILEVALPHENLIWRATKVTEASVPEASVVPPKKGKAVNSEQLFETLKDVFKNRGNGGQINMVMKAYLM